MEGVKTAGDTPSLWFNRVYTTSHVRDSYTHRVCGSRHLNNEYNMFEDPCFVIGRMSKVRIFFVTVVDHPRFDKTVLFVIMLNVVVEIMEIPSLNKYDWTHDVATYGDRIFLAVFSVEAALKVGAMGFAMHRNSYLRDAWNVGDFSIVLLGFVSEIFSGNKLNFIRLVRLVRPLRAIRRIRGMRVLVNTLFAAIPMMRDVLGLLILVMYVFAILGIQMWKGVLHKRCYAEMGSSYSFVYNDTSVCGSRTCGSVDNLNITCDIKTNMYTEQTFNFDYIWYAMLLVFKVVTLDDWPENMKMVQDASSPYSWVYFVLLTLMGGYFCLNLVLAILAVVYTESQRKKMSATVKLITPGGQIPYELSGNERDVIREKLKTHHQEVTAQLRREGKLMAAKTAGKKTQTKLLLAMFQGPKTETTETVKQIEWQETREEERAEEDHYVYVPDKLTAANYCGVYFMQTVGVLALGELLLPDGINDDEDILSYPPSESDYTSQSLSAFGEGKRPPWWRRPFVTICASSYFKNSLIAVTVINVLMMATDHQNASKELLIAIDNTNIFASWIFFFEMAFKLIGLGPKNYFRDNYNILDFTLVLLAMPEIFQLTSNLSSFTAFRAFRGFRLMVRIKALQMTVDRIARSFSAVVWLLLLMLLLIFIFAILGLNIFEKAFPIENRENFRSLWEAGLTVFIVITGDTWSTIMQRAMQHAGAVSVLYFIPLFVIGNLMLINLFIAIMIDHFKGSEHDAETAFFTKGADQAAKKSFVLKTKKTVAPTELQRHVKFNNSLAEVSTERGESASSSASTKEEPSNKESNSKEQLTSTVHTFERFWSRGWRVSISHKHGRPFWWKDDQKVWVLPVNLRDDTELNSDETNQLLAIQANEEGAFPGNLEHHEVDITSPKKDEQSYHMTCFSPYKPSPWEIRKLMNTSDFLSVLEIPEVGNLRLFYYCATKKTREYVISLWQRTNATKRDFLQKLAEGGVLCPSSIPPTYKDFLQEENAAYGRTVSDPNISSGYTSEEMQRRSSIATTMSMESSDFEKIHLKQNPYSLDLFGKKSLMLFTRDNAVRVFLAKIILHPYFNDAMLIIILINAIFLGLDDYYVDDRPGGKLLIEVANATFVLIFLLEMVSKIIVLGFKRYWKNVWNRIDATIATALLADVIGVPYASKLRCVRTVRLLVRLEALSVVVKALLRALPQIAYICVVCLFVWVVFGILGVQLFKGKFAACNDSSVSHITNCSGVYYVSAPTATDPNATKLALRQWSNYRVHFDHIGMASVALFELSVTENWAPMMWRAVDGDSGGEVPKHNNHPERSIYFVAFVVVGNFFCTNLFVGSLINQFNSDMETLQTRSQAKDAAYSRIISLYSIEHIPARPKNIIRAASYDFVLHPYFDKFVLITILLNCAVLGSEHFGQPDYHSSFLAISNYIFVVVFSLEAILKMLAMGVSDYFGDAWNRFDFTSTSLSVLGVVVQSVNTGGFRIMRVFRAFRLLKKARHLNLLFQTLLSSLPSLCNISLLMMYVFFNWGVVGVEMFKDVKDNPKLGGHNFRTLPSAVLLLYQIGTTEGWTSLMDGTSLNPPDCEPSLGNCGKEWGHYPYFISYIIFGSYVTMNLFIFVVMHNFEKDRQVTVSHNQKSNLLQGFEALNHSWMDIAVQQQLTDRMSGVRTNRIDIDDFLDIAKSLPEPIWRPPVRLFFRSPSSQKWINLIENFKQLPVSIPVYKPRRHKGQHQVEYADVLRAFAMRVAGLRREDIYKNKNESDIQKFGDRSFDLSQLLGAKRIIEIWTNKRDENRVRQKELRIEKANRQLAAVAAILEKTRKNSIRVRKAVLIDEDVKFIGDKPPRKRSLSSNKRKILLASKMEKEKQLDNGAPQNPLRREEEE